MNCTVCKKPVEEHGESEATDICIAKKLGWQYRQEAPKGFWCSIDDYDVKRTDLGWWLRPGDKEETGWACGNPSCGPVMPHYSFPEMTPETWSLVERIPEFLIVRCKKDWWNVTFGQGGRDKGVHNAPTPTLAICRAFLAMEE